MIQEKPNNEDAPTPGDNGPGTGYGEFIESEVNQ